MASNGSCLLNHSSEFVTVFFIFLSSKFKNKSYKSNLLLGTSISKYGAFRSIISLIFVNDLTFGV